MKRPDAAVPGAVMLSLGLASLVSSAAFAQQDTVGGLEEVVVTARKREEALQTVPLAITAFTGEQIRRAGIADLADLARLTPGLVFTEIGGSGLTQTPVIRGIVATNLFASQNNVAVFLDNVYLSSRRSLNLQLLDMERVEVLKGPQGSAYGQSAYNGAINYVTKGPGEQFEGLVSGSVGTDEYYEARVAAGGPVIADKLGVRVAASVGGFDGTYENTVNTGENLQGYKSKAASLVAKFTPTDRLTLTGRFYWSENNREQDGVVLIANNCGVNAAGGGFTRFCGEVPTHGFSAGISPEAFGLQSDTRVGSLSIDFDVTDNLQFTNLASYQKAVGVSLLDSDLTPPAGYPLVVINTVTGARRTQPTNFFFGSGNTTDEDWSEEARLTYTSENLTVAGGVYYFKQKSYVSTTFPVDGRGLGANERFELFLANLFRANDPFGNPTKATVNAFETKDIAGFGEVSYRFNDQVRVNAELRYTEETTDFTKIVAGTAPVPAATCCTSGTWKFWNPRLSVDYTAREGLMFYASAAKGTRSGGFSGTSSPNVPGEGLYKPENNLTYELGVRSQWLDRRVTANATIFYSKLSDLQVSQRSADPNFIFNITGNIGKATAQGFEIETTAAITDSFGLTFNYSYTDPKFDSDQFAFGVGGCGVGTAACGSLPNAQGGLPVGGKQLAYSRKTALNAGAVWSFPAWASWRGSLRADVRHESKAFVEAINTISTPAITVANARIGLENERYELTLWAKNLFDEEYVSFASNETRINSLPGVSYSQGNGRQLGVTASVKF